MRAKSIAGMRAAWAFLKFLHRETARHYRYQYGLVAVVPVIWGCLDAFLWPRIAPLGFLFTALFLEGRPGKRLAWQSLAFTAWCIYLGAVWQTIPSTTLGAKPNFQIHKLIGTVYGVPTLSPRCSFLFSTDRGLVRIQAEAPTFKLETGQTLALQVRESPPSPPTNSGQFDFPAYLRSQGVRAAYCAESLELLRPPPWYHRGINFIHAILDRTLTRSVPASQVPLLRACLLGSSEGLDPQIVEDFKASGMLHILAISGQHIGLLALILLQIFSLLRLPRKAAFLVTGILIAIYVPVCGGTISVLRSALMFWCVIPGILWERPGVAMNNLGWAAVIGLLWMPYQILSLGFQLSYAATFFLILYSRSLASLLKQLHIRHAVTTYLVSTLILSVILYLAAYPVLASSMHATAPSSLVGNLVTISLSSGMLVASCLTILTGPWPLIPKCFGEMAGGFSQGLTTCIHVLAHGPGAAQSVATLPCIWGLFLIFLLVTFPYAARTGRGRILILVGITAFSGRWAYLQTFALWKEPSSVTFLDVGQGDGALCILPEANILIDAGPEEAGRNVILPYLRFHGINRLDLVVVTHPDLDHYGGLAYVAEHVDIGRVVYPGIEAETMAWKKLHAVLVQHHIPMIPVRRGQRLYGYPDISLSVLSPAYSGQFPERNDNSVVTYLEMRGQRLLFTGDMEAPAQEFLLSHAYPNLVGSILKVPHHGSDRSNPSDFLETLHPEIAILSAGRKNRFGHPGPVTVQALQNLGAKLFFTTKQGAITYASDRSHSGWSTWVANM